MLTPSADDIGAFFDAPNHVGKVVGIVLEIAVGCRDKAPFGVLDPGGKCSSLPEIASKADDAPPRIVLLMPHEAFEAVVGAPIVDDDDLVRSAPRRQRFGDLAVQLINVRRFVPNRHDERQVNIH